MDAVRLEGISKSYRQHLAVDGLDLRVPEGSIYGFIGPNGSGKTTTIRMILHIILPDAGRIEVLGRSETRSANDEIGYLPEERGLYRKMTVSRLLRYFGSIKGLGTRQAKQEAHEWLERIGLPEVGKKKIEALSKGMAQKIQFIAAVMGRPKLVILDEPFSGLDPVNLEVVRQQILALRKAGTTVIFSTHDMSAAEEMCDFVFMIHKGKKVLDGSLDGITAEYGADTIRVRCREGASPISGLKGIDHVRDLGHTQELRSSRDPQQILADLAAISTIEHFEITRPSLQDIFVRIAGPTADTAPAPEAVALPEDD